MSAFGQKQTFAAQNGMSALPPIADIRGAKTNVRFVPKADSFTVTTRGRLMPPPFASSLPTSAHCGQILQMTPVPGI